jgi:hypothetical protein
VRQDLLTGKYYSEHKTRGTSNVVNRLGTITRRFMPGITGTANFKTRISLHSQHSPGQTLYPPRLPSLHSTSSRGSLKTQSVH